jgi:exodeoxyribonuclease V gamma subunit
MQPALRLSAWLRLLALSATYPEVPFEAQTIGRASKGSRRAVSVAAVGPLDADPEIRRDVARTHLAGLVRIFQSGMGEPLPIFCKTSAAYALERALGREPGEAVQAARKEWESWNKRDNENRDREHLFVLGEELSFPDMLTRTGIPSAEEGVDLDPSEPSRFGVYARLVWDGLLDLEKIRLQ